MIKRRRVTALCRYCRGLLLAGWFSLERSFSSAPGRGEDDRGNERTEEEARGNDRNGRDDCNDNNDRNGRNDCNDNNEKPS